MLDTTDWPLLLKVREVYPDWSMNLLFFYWLITLIPLKQITDLVLRPMKKKLLYLYVMIMLRVGIWVNVKTKVFFWRK